MKKIIILLCIPFFFLRCDSFLDVNPDSHPKNYRTGERRMVYTVELLSFSYSFQFTVY